MVLLYGTIIFFFFPLRTPLGRAGVFNVIAHPSWAACAGTGGCFQARPLCFRPRGRACPATASMGLNRQFPMDSSGRAGPLHFRVPESTREMVLAPFFRLRSLGGPFLCQIAKQDCFHRLPQVKLLCWANGGKPLLPGWAMLVQYFLGSQKTGQRNCFPWGLFESASLRVWAWCGPSGDHTEDSGSVAPNLSPTRALAESS